MGYYTNYKISTQGKPLGEGEKEALDKLIKEAESLPTELKKVALKGIEQERGNLLKDLDPETIVTSHIDYNPFEDNCKWYEHEKDMRAVSSKYPETLFLLEGEGEESGDIWKKYFLNGKMQTCKSIITFEEFDKSKLK